MNPLQNNSHASTIPTGNNAVPVQAQNNQVDNPNDSRMQNKHDDFNPADESGDTDKVSKKRDFTYSGAIKSFFKGLINPIITMIKNPFQTLLAVGAGLLLAAFVPAAIPLMIYAGIGFGAFQLGKGGYNLVQGIKEKDGEKIENAFGNFGNGTFDILTLGLGKGIITRGLKLFGKITKSLMKETAEWYRKIFFPQLYNLQPAALTCASLNIAEGAHIVHSAASMSPSGVFLGLSTFAATKYIYMGFHYRESGASILGFLHRCAVTRKAVTNLIKNCFKEFFSQASSYIFRGNKKVPLGAIAEGAPINEVQATWFSRLAWFAKHPDPRARFEHLEHLARTNPNSPELVSVLKAGKKFFSHAPKAARALYNNPDLPALQQTLKTLVTQLPQANGVLSTNAELILFQQTIRTLSTQLSQTAGAINGTELATLQQTMKALFTQLPRVANFINGNVEIASAGKTIRTLSTQLSRVTNFIDNNVHFAEVQHALNTLTIHSVTPDILQTIQHATNNNTNLQKLLTLLWQRTAYVTA